MRKPLKIFVAVIAAVLLVIVLGVAAFALFFDANAFRGRITAEVKKATGRDLAIGDIHLSVFPTLGARIKDARLSNAPGFGDAPMALIGEADVGVRLLPLLFSREVKVGTLSLSGLQLNAAKNADGKNNWDDLVKTGDKPATPEAGGSGIKSIDIGGVAIHDAAITYSDAQAKKAYTLSKLNLKTGSIAPGKPFDFALDFATSATEPALNANISLGARLALDLEKQTFSADKLTLKVKAALPEMKADIEASGNIAADLGAKVYKAEKIKASVSAEGPALHGRKEKADFTGDAIYDGAKGSFKLAGGELLAAGLIAAIAIDGSGLNGDAPRFTGPLSIKPFNPRELLNTFGTKLDTADPNVLKEMSVKAKLDATKTSARLVDLTIKLDQSTITGSAGLANIAAQAAEFALKLDAIDADRYLPPQSAVAPPQGAPTTPAEKAKADAQVLPVDALDSFSAAGTVDIGKLKFSGLNMAGVRLKVNAVKGAEKRIELAANLYGGSVNTTTRIQPGARPAYVESLRVTSIAAGPLLKDFTGKESMTGEGNVSMDVTSSGHTSGEIKRALNGDVAFSFMNGAVKGFNLGQILRQGQALLAGQQLAGNEPQQTDFTELSAKGHITNGVLQSDALNAKSPLFRVDGAGRVDLVNETLDYTAQPTIVNSATGQGGKELADLTGIVIPIHITGPWAAPKYSLDVQAALQQKATEKLRGRLDDQIQKKLGGKLGDSPLKDQINQGLDALFGRKKKPDAAPPPAPAPTR